MWSEDEKVHEECVTKIHAVATTLDKRARFELALREIIAGSAMLPQSVKFREWAGTMGMTAFHPEDFLPKTEEELDRVVRMVMGVEEGNEVFRQPNPKGRYPLCIPTVSDPDVCIRCSKKPGVHPCSAVPTDKRWGETYKGEI